VVHPTVVAVRLLDHTLLEEDAWMPWILGGNLSNFLYPGHDPEFQEQRLDSTYAIKSQKLSRAPAQLLLPSYVIQLRRNGADLRLCSSFRLALVDNSA
jgi:hypothetical protein